MRHLLAQGGLAVASLPVLCAAEARPHPASGIVVDQRGRVFFQDSIGRAIWMVDADGQLTKYSDKLGGHWMALDTDGGFARADIKLVQRITPAGAKPALLVADGGAPVAVGSDGRLYYALRLLDGGGVAVGITRVPPDGTRTRFAPDVDKVAERLGITGLAAGPDGALYVACPSAVLRVKPDGTFTTIANPVAVKDCDEDLPDNHPSPSLRGLAVDGRGTVYAAATGCHCLVRVTPDGKVETALKAERPWSPTGVAVSGEGVYVLEYTNASAGPDRGWLPRVRKRGRDGKVTTLVAISDEVRKKSP
jgi:sugar lactone lactonase YvrE